jgi:TorA maturation chaperone TorD
MSANDLWEDRDVDTCDEASDLFVAEEDLGRADLFALCARLLICAPDAEFLALLNAAHTGPPLPRESRLDRAWVDLVAQAAHMGLAAITDEFDRLFIATGTPLINPYASVYVSGFMHEKPLAALREELAGMGLARRPGRGEVEDHLAVLCEILRVMIAGEPAALRQSLTRQQHFFESHLSPWYQRCLDDIRVASGDGFYARVAELAGAFFEIEAQAFRFNPALTMEHAE